MYHLPRRTLLAPRDPRTVILDIDSAAIVARQRAARSRREEPSTVADRCTAAVAAAARALAGFGLRRGGR